MTVAYFAACDTGEKTPWAVFKVDGRSSFRYFPARGDWVKMIPSQMDWFAIGFSSDANGTRPISAQQADILKEQVIDLREDVVFSLEQD